MVVVRLWLLTVCAMTLLSACVFEADPPQVAPASPSVSISAAAPIVLSGAMARLTANDYALLSAEQKYEVSNRLLGALYKGVPVREFFDLRASTKFAASAKFASYLDDIQAQLFTPDPNYSATINAANLRYFKNSDGTARVNQVEEPLTYMHELVLSREYFDFWMAYQLMNTILFSPAMELDSVDRTDAGNLFSRLVESSRQNKSIRAMVFEHTVSQENWRRFRSPEDNVREMMEVFLMRFRDDEVPKGAQACKNWYLTDDTEGYRLIKTVDVNRDSLSLLDTAGIVTCEDFYWALVYHAQLLPAIVTRLVAHLFPNHDPAAKAAIVEAIVATRPATFRDIFTVVLFSKEFLLHNSRVKRLEEVILGTGARVDWQPHWRFFDYLTRNDRAAGEDRRSLVQMKQGSMLYKLGRDPAVPTDTLSLTYIQGAARYSLFRSAVTETTNTSMGWRTSLIDDPAVVALSEADFVDYIFLSVLARRPTAREREVLAPMLNEPSRANSRLAKANLLFDYATRLPEFYYVDKSG